MPVTGPRQLAVARPVELLAQAEEARGRVLLTRGWLYDAAGTVVAEASGRFIAATRVAKLAAKT